VLKFNTLLITNVAKKVNSSHVSKCRVFCSVADKLCDGCIGLIPTSFYNCTQCNFFLHSKCIQLPKNKWHPLHRHSLTLFSQQSIYVLGFFSCKACQRLNNGFPYRCGTCSFDFDLQCCSIPETLNHEGHQHSLFLAVNSNRRCHVL
jgi:hypothetical protein